MCQIKRSYMKVYEDRALTDPSAKFLPISGGRNQPIRFLARTNEPIVLNIPYLPNRDNFVAPLVHSHTLSTILA